MVTRTQSPTAFTFTLAAVLFIASHSISEPATAHTRAFLQFGGTLAPAGMQQTPQVQMPSHLRTPVPPTPAGAVPGQVAPAPGAAPAPMTPPHAPDPLVRNEMLDHQASPAKRQELCRKLEQRREELRQQRKAMRHHQVEE